MTVCTVVVVIVDVQYLLLKTAMKSPADFTRFYNICILYVKRTRTDEIFYHQNRVDYEPTKMAGFFFISVKLCES